MRGQRWLLAVVALQLLMGLVVVVRSVDGAGDGDGVAQAPEPTSASTSRCVEVDASFLDGIATGLVDDGATLSDGWAVRSGDFAEIYMVAARVSSRDGEEVGVWASRSLLRGDSLVFAVDGVAKRTSGWRSASESGARIADDDDGVAEARACVG